MAGFLWNDLAAGGADHAERNSAFGYRLNRLLPAFLAGLLAGTLPLVHAHSLFALFVVSACWFFFSLERWKEWIAFGAGTALIALPELGWIMWGSATNSSEFIGWHFGFDARDNNIIHFWLLNTGLFIPLVISAFALLLVRKPKAGDGSEDGSAEEIHKSSGKSAHSDHDSGFTIQGLAVYYLPFVLLLLPK